MVARVVRGVGWLLLVAGAVVLLYVVYLLWFTGLETDRAQGDLAEAWSLQVPDGADAPPTDAGAAAPADDGPEDAPAEVPDGEAEPGDPGGDAVGAPSAGGAYAAIWFERGGRHVVNDDVLYVVEGVSLERLRAGPGHYPDSDRPGGAGNLAIAGHRTTYGSPFWALNELVDGDTIHVQDRQGREWVYAYREQRVVAPGDVWVIGEDPLGTDTPTITLTTCHPRGSAAERLVAWGELLDEPIDSTAGDPIGELADA